MVKSVSQYCLASFRAPCHACKGKPVTNGTCTACRGRKHSGVRRIKRVGSDPHAITFGRILTPEERIELWRILGQISSIKDVREKTDRVQTLLDEAEKELDQAWEEVGQRT